MVEQRIQERLTNYDPTGKELLGMFVLKAGGSFPFAVSVFSEGLKAAAEIFDPLKVFVGNRDINGLTDRFAKAFEEASLKLLNNERWGIPTSDVSERNKIKASMEMILTPWGKTALEKAAKAANKVWSEREI